ncbi:hypothetical protein [Nocardia noduli]|uniref:hypothetical protein n=1 Tax=Nocardia noduli TaxID=2815722 RepID=UPI001C241581|nr:hypothetical protein [Nocardia noduli]
MNLVVAIGTVLVVAGMLGILAVALRGTGSARDHLTVAQIQARLAGEYPAEPATFGGPSVLRTPARSNRAADFDSPTLVDIARPTSDPRRTEPVTADRRPTGYRPHPNVRSGTDR